MKTIVTLICTLLIFSISSFAAAPKGITSLFKKVEQAKESEKRPSKEEILKYLEVETKKADKMDLLAVSERLYLAGEYLDEKFDEKFLNSILSFYPAILNREMSHTLVEMFADSYKKNQSRFDSLLEQKLNATQREDFKERLKAAFYEEQHGQD